MAYESTKVCHADKPILELGTARLLEGDKPWNKERLPLVEERVRNRLEPADRGIFRMSASPPNVLQNYFYD
jgi:hypothetical protein